MIECSLKIKSLSYFSNRFCLNLNRKMSSSNINDFLESIKQTAFQSDPNSNSDHGAKTMKSKRSFNDDKELTESQSKKIKSDIEKLSFGYVDSARLEYAARVLQKQIKLIIDHSPDIHQLNELMGSNLQLDNDSKIFLQQNDLIKLAVNLKTLHKEGSLGIFDQIVNGNVELAAKDKPINSANYDIKADKKEDSKSDNTEKNSQLELSGQVITSNSSLPPLPEIKDPYLYGRVFIHKSTINNKSYLQQSELLKSHNERLEFLGDSILNNLVTIIIYERFPGASEGDMSKIRSLLINNATLTEFSLSYGFDLKLKSNIHDQFLRQGKQKIFADIFEAYIGALALERKFELLGIKSFLLDLFDMKLKGFDKELKKIEQLNKDAKTELYSLVGSASFHPLYIISQTGDGSEIPYKVQCTMGSDLLGEGIAPGLKEAGLRAAMEALKNRPLLEKYTQIRLQTDRTESLVKEPSLNAVENIEKRFADSFSPPFESFVFPLIANDDEEIQTDAKNLLYAQLGHNIGITPTYVTTLGENKLYKSELRIKDFVAAIAHDKSKKRATAKAAMAILYNKKAMNEIFSIIKSRS